MLLVSYLFIYLFLQQNNEKLIDVKNQSYKEDMEKIQQTVCQKNEILKSVAAEHEGLESNFPVSAHEVNHVLVFRVVFVSVTEFLLQCGLQLKFCYK